MLRENLIFARKKVELYIIWREKKRENEGRNISMFEELPLRFFFPFIFSTWSCLLQTYRFNQPKRYRSFWCRLISEGKNHLSDVRKIVTETGFSEIQFWSWNNINNCSGRKRRNKKQQLFAVHDLDLEEKRKRKTLPNGQVLQHMLPQKAVKWFETA